MNRSRPYPHFKYPDEITIQVKKLTEKDCQWFSVPFGSYELTTINYGWFPSDAIMGVIEGKYEDTNGIGAAIRGNLGSASIAVLDAIKATELLKAQGYNVSIN